MESCEQCPWWSSRWSFVIDLVIAAVRFTIRKNWIVIFAIWFKRFFVELLRQCKGRLSLAWQWLLAIPHIQLWSKVKYQNLRRHSARTNLKWVDRRLLECFPSQQKLCKISDKGHVERPVAVCSTQNIRDHVPLEVVHFDQLDRSNWNLSFYFDKPAHCPSSLQSSSLKWWIREGNRTW